MVKIEHIIEDVLQYIQEHPGCMKTQLVHEIPHTPQVVSNVITILIKQGKIRKEGYQYFKVN